MKTHATEAERLRGHVATLANCLENYVELVHDSGWCDDADHDLDECEEGCAEAMELVNDARAALQPTEDVAQDCRPVDGARTKWITTGLRATNYGYCPQAHGGWAPGTPLAILPTEALCDAMRLLWAARHDLNHTGAAASPLAIAIDTFLMARPETATFEALYATSK